MNVSIQLEGVTLNIEGALSASDGYHSFDELYNHRHALFLALIAMMPSGRAWAAFEKAEAFGNEWILVGITLPTGPVSYHLPRRFLNSVCVAGATLLDKAPPFDGHTSSDVVDRLTRFAIKPAWRRWEEDPQNHNEEEVQ